ncbi:hypothetical protein NITHO_4670006 [Nitrolancea hollandica Lb]|uniref:Uncharacterized protein n=1 Tax=Nitrolancea hollandica Lb TaxID=1129897 RepID=I4EKK7_9BACT|nr:hypothetical protein NITHO_4670006 [Nitrolancea hollandica Lb]
MAEPDPHAGSRDRIMVDPLLGNNGQYVGNMWGNLLKFAAYVRPVLKLPVRAILHVSGQ